MYRRIALVALVAWLAVRTLSLLSAAWPFDTDDAFITLRYSQHLASGHGIVWNIGENPAVEGYSNFSFVVLGALAIVLGLEPILLFKVVCVAALAGTCAALWVLARHWVGPVVAIAPAFLLVSYVGTIHWTVSGLETAVYQYFVVAAVTCFSVALSGTDRPSSRWLAVSGLWACAAGLTRPEGAIIGVILVIALLVHLRHLRGVPRVPALAALTLTFGIPYTIYFAWRLSHFEQFLPNSVVCKAMNHDDTLLVLRDYGALVLAYLPFALAQPLRRLDVRMGVLLAIPATYALLLYGVDPIVGHFNRHALTAWALLLVAATVGLVGVLSHLPRVGRHAEWIATVILVMWAVGYVTPRREDVTARAAVYTGRMDARRAVGEWLRAALRPGESYLIGDCGLIPYVSGGTVIDAFCLNNREMTSPPISGDRHRLVARVLERRPRFLVVHSEDPDELKPRTEYGFYPALVVHRDFPQYRLVTKFGAASDTFQYWIFERSE